MIEAIHRVFYDLDQLIWSVGFAFGYVSNFIYIYIYIYHEKIVVALLFCFIFWQKKI